MREMQRLLILISLFSIVGACWAETRPTPFLREDWTTKPPFEQVSQEHVASPDLIQTVYGPGKDGIKKRHHGTDADPYYIWSGACAANWALTLKHKDAYADLTGRSKIRWRTRMSGFRRLHIIVKLADGSWLISDQSDGASEDWREHEFNVADLRWHKLDVVKVVEGAAMAHPDLTKVDEIGFTDLMNGASSPACARLDWIEVYGKPVKRPEPKP
jgi:hypothetical protein